MNIRTLCLAILSAGDATGYEIRKSSMEGKFSYFVDASYGAIYPALAKLEADGCVTCREETQPGKPARKVYSITGKGREAFYEALCEPPEQDIFRSEFLLIAVCAAQLPRDVVARAIAVREKQLAEKLELVRSIKDSEHEAGTQWVCSYGLTCISRSLDQLVATKDELMAIAGCDINTDALAAAE